MTDVFIPSRSGPSAVLGPLEGEIMEGDLEEGRCALGGRRPSRSASRGRPISYSAVKAVLNNLTDKKQLTKTREGKVTFFAAAISREAFDAKVVSIVVRSLETKLRDRSDR